MFLFLWFTLSPNTCFKAHFADMLLSYKHVLPVTKDFIIGLCISTLKEPREKSYSINFGGPPWDYSQIQNLGKFNGMLNPIMKGSG